jgi:hypothetical protein
LIGTASSMSASLNRALMPFTERGRKQSGVSGDEKMSGQARQNGGMVGAVRDRPDTRAN